MAPPGPGSLRRAFFSSHQSTLHNLLRVDDTQKYALRPHPGSFYPEVPYNGVSLACTRDQEAVSVIAKLTHLAILTSFYIGHV